MTTHRAATASLALLGLLGVLLVPTMSGAAPSRSRRAGITANGFDQRTSALPLPVVRTNRPRIVVPRAAPPAVTFRGVNFDRMMQHLQLMLSRIRNARARDRLRIVFCSVFGGGFCASP